MSPRRAPSRAAGAALRDANAAAPGPVAARSFEPLAPADLARCAELALADLASLFRRKPGTGRLYADRLLLLALCQGAAEHALRGRHGVKDLDVWAFFAAHPARPFPHRRRGRADFGPSRLGRHPADPGFTGRRIDILGRSIACDPGADPAGCVRDWLRRGATRSARLIALRPVVAIHPPALLGQVLWDPGPPPRPAGRRTRPRTGARDAPAPGVPAPTLRAAPSS
jgi:hypothetical protein